MPPAATVSVDARGLRCPLPVLRLARAMRDAPGAATFDLRSDDPATAAELAAWCRETGHSVTAAAAGWFTIARC